MKDQRGQATPLLALLVLAVGGFTLGLARVGGTATPIAPSQAAADAAALAAAAAGGEDAATSYAEANGGHVVTYEEDGAEVQVRVQVGDGWAVARARRTGGGRGVRGWVGESSSGGIGRTLSTPLHDALEAAAALLHQPVPIVGSSGTGVAVPGHFAARLDAIAGRVGLCRLPSSTDPVRFAPCRVRPR
jgi:hypothetical protein